MENPILAEVTRGDVEQPAFARLAAKAIQASARPLGRLFAQAGASARGILASRRCAPMGADVDRSVVGALEAFWNRVEAFEKRSDAQLAKDLTIALPPELSPAQNIALIRDFIERQILSKGMVAD